MNDTSINNIIPKSINDTDSDNDGYESDGEGGADDDVVDDHSDILMVDDEKKETKQTKVRKVKLPARKKNVSNDKVNVSDITAGLDVLKNEIDYNRSVLVRKDDEVDDKREGGESKTIIIISIVSSVLITIMIMIFVMKWYIKRLYYTDNEDAIHALNDGEKIDENKYEDMLQMNERTNRLADALMKEGVEVEKKDDGTGLNGGDKNNKTRRARDKHGRFVKKSK